MRCFKPEISNQEKKRIPVNNQKETKEYSKLFTDKKLLEEFKYFLQNEFSENTIEFYEDIQIFKSLKTEEEKSKMAIELYQKYLDEKGLKEVPIKIGTRQSIRNTINSISKVKVEIDIFDEAVREITTDILLDPWTRFQSLENEEVKNIVEKGRIKKFKLEDVFLNEHLYYIFKKYLKKEIAEEILLFYEEIQKFRKIEVEKERFEEAKGIFQKYIENSSPCEININSYTREMIKEIVEKKMNERYCPKEIFDDIFIELKQSSLQEIWSRFQNTDEYNQLFE